MAADKYALDLLTVLCVPYILYYMTEDNVPMAFQMAHTHSTAAGATALKHEIKNYAMQHFDDVLLSPVKRQCLERIRSTQIVDTKHQAAALVDEKGQVPDSGGEV